jgi:hypothetical protein
MDTMQAFCHRVADLAAPAVDLGALDNFDAARLQQAMAGLGAVVGSSKIVVPISNALDPATVAAVNWTFTQHIGPGQAPTYLRTGSLTDGGIREHILEITYCIVDEIVRRGNIPPFTALPPLPTGQVSMDAYTALNAMMSRYKLLSAIAGVLVRVEQVTQKALPCAVVSGYNQLVLDYRAFGQSIFNALGARGLEIQQVAYQNGQPAVDASGQVQVYKIQGPLLPPDFSKRAACPNMVALQGSSGLGIAPLIVGLYVIGAVIVKGAGGYFGAQALRDLQITVHGPQRDSAQDLTVYAKCVIDTQAKGSSASKAATQCQTAATKDPGFGKWAWIGIGAAFLVLGGGLLLYLQRSARMPVVVSDWDVPNCKRRRRRRKHTTEL